MNANRSNIYETTLLLVRASLARKSLKACLLLRGSLLILSNLFTQLLLL